MGANNPFGIINLRQKSWEFFMKKIFLIIILILITFSSSSCKNVEHEVFGGEMLKIDLCMNYSNECSFFLPLISNKKMNKIELNAIKGENVNHLDIITTPPKKDSEDIFQSGSYYVTLFGVRILTQEKSVFPIKIESFEFTIDGSVFIFETPSINISHYKLLSDKAEYLTTPDFVYDCNLPLVFNNLTEKEMNVVFLSNSDISIKKYYASAFIEYDEFVMGEPVDNMNIACEVKSGLNFSVNYKLKPSQDIESFHIIRASRIIQYTKPDSDSDFFFITINGYCIQDIKTQIAEYIDWRMV
jgi:hypothetical protein